MSLTRQWHKQVFAYIDHRLKRPQRLVLAGGAGSGGGTGYPPGGVVGKLPQIYICYDTTEGTSSASTPDPSLLHNLNRIRGGWALGDDSIQERHMLWSTACTAGTSGCIQSYHIPFHSVTGLIASVNVRDAIDELAGSSSPLTNFWMWHTFIFTVEGAVGTSTGNLRIYTSGSFTIDHVFAAVNTAPGTQALIVDVNKNGSTIFTDQDGRPQIAAGAYTDASDTPDITELIVGDYLTMDVDQVGVSPAGSDLVVHVRCKQYLLPAT